MNLKEFIIDTFIANSIEWNDGKVDEMSKQIEDYARKKADGSRCIAISDDEIRQFIIDSRELLEKMAREKAEEKAKRLASVEEQKAREKELKEQRRREKAEEEKQPYQLELF